MELIAHLKVGEDLSKSQLCILTIGQVREGQEEGFFFCDCTIEGQFSKAWTSESFGVLTTVLTSACTARSILQQHLLDNNCKAYLFSPGHNEWKQSDLAGIFVFDDDLDQYMAATEHSETQDSIDRLQLNVEFGQVLIVDSETDELNSPEIEWDAAAISNFGAWDDGVVALGFVEKSGTYLVEFSVVEVFTTASEEILGNWDHVVDFPFKSSSGVVEVGDEFLEIGIGEFSVRWSIRERDGCTEYNLLFLRDSKPKFKIRKQKTI